MTLHARSTPKWRFNSSDGTVSLVVRSVLWLAIILMMIIPLTGAGRF